jgi:hypothetical protein
MLVMHFVSFANSPEVQIIRARKPIEALMNEDIMYQKIGYTIKQDSQSDKKAPIKCCDGSKYNEKATWHCENEEECVISFKKGTGGSVVIFVKIPHPTMHHKLVRAPGNSLHCYIRGQRN